MEFIAAFFNFIFNFFIGLLMFHALLLFLEKRKEKEIRNKEEDDVIKTVVSTLSKSKPTYIEKFEDQYLLYDSMKNTFLCQSNTLEGLAESCYKYSKIDLAIVKYKEDFMIFREGAIIREGEEMEIRT